ncbi:MAG: radical SAM protein [Actinomycetia bacterium]|nr:radical SAM protein [Actinomycetes bacterium]
MISITKLLTGAEHYGDSLRYTSETARGTHGVSTGKGPVVVWNCTRTCNLRCAHCYSASQDKAYQNELDNGQARALIDDLAAFQSPVLLFSGGEPLMRQDILELIAHAVQRGIRATLSTNGTLIDPEMAAKLKELGVGYVGISLDGLEPTNDRFRGQDGAFAQALAGIRNCVAVGQRVGLRFTINKHNYTEIDSIFDLLEAEQVDRVCFYHLVYSGRGHSMRQQDISAEQSRAVMERIIERTMRMREKGLSKEVLTVDNHADGVYLYLKMKDPAILQMLRRNGGNRSGIAIGCVDNEGNVHADQFSGQYSFGNVKNKPFSEIWREAAHPILAGLRDRKPLLKGRCASCTFLDVCNGNFRTRAEAVSGDFWESDPACYLTDEEIRMGNDT